MSRAFRLLKVDETGISDIEASLRMWRDNSGFTLLYRARREGSFVQSATGAVEAEIAVASALANLRDPTVHARI